jgi:hypothetical protein
MACGPLADPDGNRIQASRGMTLPLIHNLGDREVPEPTPREQRLGQRRSDGQDGRPTARDDGQVAD